MTKYRILTRAEAWALLFRAAADAMRPDERRSGASLAMPDKKS